MEDFTNPQTSSSADRNIKQGSTTGNMAARQEDRQHQRNERLQELAKAVHRLRNPATGIFAAAECLIADDSGSFTEKQIGLLQGIMNSASAMLSILEEMTGEYR